VLKNKKSVVIDK